MDFQKPNIVKEVFYIKFIEKTISVQFPGHLNDPELFYLLKTYQVHAHFKIYWKYNNECRFSYGRYFTEKKIIAKPLDSKFSNEEKQEILTWKKKLLRHVKSYIHNNLYPAKLNVLHPTKDSFTSH